jgi:hypothetical protein
MERPWSYRSEATKFSEGLNRTKEMAVLIMPIMTRAANQCIPARLSSKEEDVCWIFTLFCSFSFIFGSPLPAERTLKILEEVYDK